MIDDGTACHRGEGKDLINDYTDGQIEMSLQQRIQDGVSIIRNNDELNFNNNDVEIRK